MKKKKTGILSYGAVRGLIGQVVGTVIGLAFISLLRLILGMGWNPEPSWVFAMVVGFFGFLIGIGAFSDWLKAARGQEITPHPHDPEEWTGLRRYLSFSVDHKVIGIQYGHHVVNSDEFPIPSLPADRGCQKADNSAQGLVLIFGSFRLRPTDLHQRVATSHESRVFAFLHTSGGPPRALPGCPCAPCPTGNRSPSALRLGLW